MSHNFKTDWDYNDVIEAEDMNRIEGIIKDHDEDIEEAKNSINDNTESIEGIEQNISDQNTRINQINNVLETKLESIDEIYFLTAEFHVDQGYDVDIESAEVNINIPERFNVSNTMIAGIMIHGYHENFTWNNRDHNIQAEFITGGPFYNYLHLLIDKIKSRKTYTVRVILINKADNEDE